MAYKNSGPHLPRVPAPGLDKERLMQAAKGGGRVKTKIKLFATGGTIASAPSGAGLSPAVSSSGLMEFLQGVPQDVKIDTEDLFSLDSSNIQPEEWQIMAQKIYACLPDYDGVIITHGTDTMAYTAAALSFMLQNIKKPVVLTGSQVPIGEALSDGQTNLFTAIAAVQSGIRGVSVAFDHKIICGTRAVKVSTMDFGAFESVNAEYMAQVYADGLRVYSHGTTPVNRTAETQLCEDLCTDVFLLKLIPGTSPDIFDALLKMDYKGIVIEAFGAGGMHYLNRNLLDKLSTLCAAGISVVVCSQCLYDRSDLSLYEVGQRILQCGAVSALDMTTEAAVTKLMWALGQTKDAKEVAEIFSRSIAGEISPE